MCQYAQIWNYISRQTVNVVITIFRLVLKHFTRNQTPDTSLKQFVRCFSICLHIYALFLHIYGVSFEEVHLKLYALPSSLLIEEREKRSLI